MTSSDVVSRIQSNAQRRHDAWRRRTPAVPHPHCVELLLDLHPRLVPTTVTEILHSERLVPRHLLHGRIDRRLIDALAVDTQHEIANSKTARCCCGTILDLRDHHTFVRLEVREGTNRIRNGRDRDAKRRVAPWRTRGGAR